MRLGRLVVRLICLSSFLVAASCGGPAETTDGARATAPAASTPVTSGERVSPAADGRPRVVFLGDSLTAGLGLSPDEAYPALLQKRIDAEGLPFHVVNAGVSGDTSAGGLSRLDWSLEGDVRVLVVALGGIDALRGLPVTELQRNLSTIIEQAQARGIRVILAGMEAPPNFGQVYSVEFHQAYPGLAKKYNVPLVPFLLEGVAGVETLNQRDGIHPTAVGARRLADNVWSVLGPTLKGS